MWNLLTGTAGHHSAVFNNMTGPPIDRDGNLLLEDDGSPKTSAQPPFLFRFLPALFAREASSSINYAVIEFRLWVEYQAPAMSHHDPETNRLSLQDGRREPWRRIEHGNQRSTASTWLYCNDCAGLS